MRKEEVIKNYRDIIAETESAINDAREQLAKEGNVAELEGIDPIIRLVSETSLEISRFYNEWRSELVDMLESSDFDGESIETFVDIDSVLATGIKEMNEELRSMAKAIGHMATLKEETGKKGLKFLFKIHRASQVMGTLVSRAVDELVEEALIEGDR